MFNYIDRFEQQAKRDTLSHLTAQFSGVLLVDEIGQIESKVDYLVNDAAISYLRPTISNNTTVDLVNRIRRAWALPGYILSESISNQNINPAITLPTLPFGFTIAEPDDILLVTTIPKYWYPEVPNGDRLKHYELAFNRPFFEVKTNRQLFKVKQHNILEEGVIVLQLSGIPITGNNNNNIGTLFSSNTI